MVPYTLGTPSGTPGYTWYTWVHLRDYVLYEYGTGTVSLYEKYVLRRVSRSQAGCSASSPGASMALVRVQFFFIFFFHM